MHPFNQIKNRFHTNSVKYDMIHLEYPKEELEECLPMWVADMDFSAPKAINEAIIAIAKEGIYGYSNRPTRYNNAIIQWQKDQFNHKIQEEFLSFSPCVMTSMVYLIKKLTKPGDKVLIQTPVYSEFATAIKAQQAIVLENPLYQNEVGRYLINFIDFEEKLKEAKLFIFCSPHNPVGRVWKKEELEKITDLLIKYQVPIISDEIHADLTLYNFQHHVITTINEKIKAQTYLLFSASKTFNLASLHASSLLFPTKEEKINFDLWLKDLHIDRNNIFSLAAVEAAYNHGLPWLLELRQYLVKSLEWITSFVEKELPKILVTPMEATYLLWLDCRALELNNDELKDFFYNKVKVIVNMGESFGSSSSGFVRINIATSLDRIELAFKRIKIAYDHLLNL